MATRKQVMDAIKKLGCTVDEMECDPDMLTIDAPKGKLFACVRSHCLCEPLVDHFHPKPRSEAYAAILEDLSYGLEDCTDPECGNCHDTEDLCETCEFSFPTGLEDEPKEGFVWCSESQQWKKCDYHCGLYRYDHELPSREG
jgi:hypothetical protein